MVLTEKAVNGMRRQMQVRIGSSSFLVDGETRISLLVLLGVVDHHPQPTAQFEGVFIRPHNKQLGHAAVIRRGSARSTLPTLCGVRTWKCSVSC